MGTLVENFLVAQYVAALASTINSALLTPIYFHF